MFKNKKEKEYSDDPNGVKDRKYVSGLEFVTFHFVTKCLNDISKGCYEFPKLNHKVDFTKFSDKIEENARKVRMRKENIFNWLGISKRGPSYRYAKIQSSGHDVIIPEEGQESALENKVEGNETACSSKKKPYRYSYYIHYTGIVGAVVNAFRTHLFKIVVLNLLQTLLIACVALIIDRYITSLKNIDSISQMGIGKLFHGFFVIIMLVVELVFTCLMFFFNYELLLHMEITLMYFLFNINLSQTSNIMVPARRGGDKVLMDSLNPNPNPNPDVDNNEDQDHPTGPGQFHSFYHKNYLYISDHKYNEDTDPASDGNDSEGRNNKEEEPSTERKKRIFRRKERKRKKEEAFDLNIYNIMFIDTPYLVYCIFAVKDIMILILKFSFSFYFFYLKMGYQSAMRGILLTFFLYGSMTFCEYLGSLFKNSYLKYRDKRIDNMHHVLKEYKLIKILNWEHRAFDYVNYFRKKEMKYCKIRIYLSTLSNYLHDISGNIIEVIIFFFFMRSQLNNNSVINFTAFFSPLLVYKSVVTGAANFPNLINDIIEGMIALKRLNRYVYYYLYDNNINDYMQELPIRNIKNNGWAHEKTIPLFEKCVNDWVDKEKNKQKKKQEEEHESMNRETNQSVEHSKKNETENKREKSMISSHSDVLKIRKIEDEISVNLSKEISPKKKKQQLILQMDNCYFQWKGSHSTKKEHLLKNINFTLESGCLSIILGDVGSGKTSLFKSILGETHLSDGYMKFHCDYSKIPILYVPQYVWVNIGTIRSMILFGNKYNSLLYHLVIMQSELINDVVTFRNKDLRYINDGHNLSNGQKTRICLARALYHHYMHMLESNEEFAESRREQSRINPSQSKRSRYSGEGSKVISETESLTSCCNSLDPAKPNSDCATTGKEEGIRKSSNTSSKQPQGSRTRNSLDTLFGNKKSLKKYLKEENVNYLYLLDDIFTALDPFICKNIFMNLFCSNEENECFKDHCGFILSVNENILHSFLSDEILNQLQYKVKIYKLQEGTLNYVGTMREYAESNRGNRKEEFVSQRSSIQPHQEQGMNNGTLMNRKRLHETIARLQIGTMNSTTGFRRAYSSRRDISKELKYVNVHKDSSNENETEVTLSSNPLSSTLSNTNQDIQYNDISVHTSFDEENEEDAVFHGNIKMQTFLWYLKSVGIALIILILCLMVFTIFTEEFKNFLFFMISKIPSGSLDQFKMGSSPNSTNGIGVNNNPESVPIGGIEGGRYLEDVINEQAKYVRLFIILPVTSLVTSFFCFFLIAYGNIRSANGIHTEVLRNVLNSPMHVFYNTNVGNIINRFITDVNVLDTGVLKRFYKTIFCLCRFMFTIALLVIMIKNTLFVVPFILILIYLLIFRKYSSGCKESQRGYLSAHSPLCNMYSNTLLGKNVINLYDKKAHFLKLYEEKANTFKNFTILKWSITVWASLYTQLIVLLLTIFYVLYPHLLFFFNQDLLNNESQFQHCMITVGYSIMFSHNLGVVLKNLLYEYTHVEKEMCSIQRLEECSQMINEGSGEIEKAEVNTSDGEDRRVQIKDATHSDEEKEEGGGGEEGRNKENNKTQMLVSINECKSKYGVLFENVYVSYKEKIYIDKRNNIYKYSDEKCCLKNINLFALKNQNIGIVGRSGSGKSTIILSILGLVKTKKGHIYIDGEDIRNIDRATKNHIIGVLPQSSFVFFNWNLRTFIDPYNYFTDNEIVEACKTLGINIEKEALDKYIYKKDRKRKGKEKLGEPQMEEQELKSNSRKERREQKQKKKNQSYIYLSNACIRYLCLVRLFLNRNRYKLILIDEIPVFNYDKIEKDSKMNNFLTSEFKSFDYILKNYFANTTVFIVAHDTSSLSCCDFIYAISQGEVVYRCSCKDIKSQSELARLLEKIS